LKLYKLVSLILHSKLSNTELRRLIKNGCINLAGNKKLKIFGALKCSSGKRMKRNNRVFFSSQNEAIQLNFRPCGNCMKNAFKAWKKANYKDIK